jgi:hypothetical protein
MRIYTNAAWACSMLGLAPRMTNVDRTRMESQRAQSIYLLVLEVTESG